MKSILQLARALAVVAGLVLFSPAATAATGLKDLSLLGTNSVLSGASFTIASGSTLTVSGTFSGTPTGGTLNLAAVTLNLGTIASGNASNLTSIPAFSLIGTVAAARFPAFTGDVTTEFGTIATTLATVATAGTTGSSTAIPIITINPKGLTTGITTAVVVAPAGTLSGATLAAGVTASSLTSVGTLGALTVTAPITGSVTGNAATATALATGRTLAITGDLAYTSPSFTGAGNVTAAGTLATVNAGVGSFGTATQSATITLNAKGLATAGSNTTIAIPASAISDGTALGRGLVNGATQTANLILAGPASGAAAAPTMRGLAQADVQAADAPLRNALATQGGLSLDGTASNTASAADSAALAYGLDDFSHIVKVRLPTYTPAAEITLVEKASANLGWQFRLTTGGILRLRLGNGSNYTTFSYDSTVAVGVGAFKTAIFAFTATRSGNVIFYLDGVQLGAAVSIAGSVAQTSTSVGALRIGFDGTTSATGIWLSHTPYNLALTAAEILQIYELGGAVPERFKTGSQSLLNTTSPTGFNGISESGASSTGATATGTATNNFGSGLYFNPGGSVTNARVGMRFRAKYDITVSGGSAPRVAIGWDSNGTWSNEVVTATGTGWVQELSVTADANSGKLAFRNLNTEVANYAISNVAWTRLGAVAHYDADLDGVGLQLRDQLANRLDATITATGAGWTKPALRNVVTFQTSTNGNQQILGQQALPASARITSWVVNRDATAATINLGNASGGAQFVSALVLGAGLNDITLLTRFCTTNNLWTNSNSTAVLTHTISYEIAN